MRRLALLLGMSVAASGAHAQTYPSPHLNNVTIDGAISGGSITATGSTTARTLADRASDAINVRDYGAKCDGSTDDTAAFTAALTHLTGATFGGAIYIPAGDCVLSGALTLSIGANQRFELRSDGQHAARLHWSNAASAGISVTFNPVANGTWISNGPSASVENITFVADWTGTTSQTALAFTAQQGDNTTTFSRPLPPAVYVRNFDAVDKHNSGGFAGLVSLSGIATSKLENLSLWASSGDTTANTLSISSPNPVISTGIRVNGLRQQNGGTAVIIGAGMQGVYLTDVQTVNTQHSVSWNDPGGFSGPDNLIVDHSQLNSQISEIDTNGVIHVQISDTYFLSNASGWYGVKLEGGYGHTIANNIFMVPSGDATQSGIILDNCNGGCAVTGNNLFGIKSGSATAAPILLSGSTNGATVVGNPSQWTYAVWDASSNPASNRIQSNVGAVSGQNSVQFVPAAAGSLITNITVQGVDSNAGLLFLAKGLPNNDYYFRDGIGHSILVLQDSQSSGSSNFVTIKAKPSGSSVQIGAGASGYDLALGATGQQAASVADNLPQIPYVNATPTGTPSSTGGATLLYNAASHTLNIYDPVASGWYHVALTAGAN